MSYYNINVQIYIKNVEKSTSAARIICNVQNETWSS